MYKCEFPGCKRVVPLRSTLKTGEHKGLKVCPTHKSMVDGGLKKTSKINKKVVKRGKNLVKYFSQRIEEMKLNPVCENCGQKINVSRTPHHNVAHILSKSRYKSVMDNPNNVLFLCAEKDYGVSDVRSCHGDFDKSISKRESMPVFKQAVEKYKLFKDQVEENGVERKSLENHC